MFQGQTVLLGTFETEEAAARCWDKATVQAHGSAQVETNFSVHPATVESWLKERMPKGLADLVRAAEGLPQGSPQKKPRRKGKPRSSAVVPLSQVEKARAAAAEAIAGLEELRAGPPPAPPSEGRLEQRRRKRSFPLGDDWTK